MDVAAGSGVAFDPGAALAPLRRALTYRRGLQWSLRGFIIGLAAAACVLLLRHVTVFGSARTLALAMPLIGAAAGLAASLLHRPTALAAARRADSVFGLEDRLTTALELRGAVGPVAVRQMSDTERRIDGLRLADAAATSWRRLELLAAALVVLILVAGLFLPQAAAARPQRAQQPSTGMSASSRAAALAQLQAVRKSFTDSLTQSQRNSEAARRALAAFSRLRSQLQHARSQADGLRAVSSTEAQLQQDARLLNPVRGSSVKQVAKSLHGYMTKQQNNQAAKGPVPLDKATSSLLKHLGAATSSMSASQKQDVARALQAAANTQSDAQLKADFTQAASALGHNDAKTAAEALRHAAQRIERSPDAGSLKSKVRTAGKRLDAVKSNVNRLHTPGSAAPNNALHLPTNAPGSPLKGGKDPVGAAGPSSQGGRAVHGKGNRTRGSSATDLRKVGGGTSQAGGSGGKASAVVYVPGLAARGHHLLPFQVEIAPKRVPAVPYRQVFVRYSSAARDALGRESLPPALRKYVRQYFTTLSK